MHHCYLIQKYCRQVQLIECLVWAKGDCREVDLSRIERECVTVELQGLVPQLYEGLGAVVEAEGDERAHGKDPEGRLEPVAAA